MKKKNIVTSSIIGLLSSALAVLGMVGVCGFPLLAAFLAWFGIGASQLSFLSEYQSLFTATAIIALLYGFYTLYFKKSAGNSSACCGNDEIDNRTSCRNVSTHSNKLAKAMLWIAALAVIGTFFMDSNARNPTPVNSSCSSNGTTGAVIELAPSNSPCFADTSACMFEQKKMPTDNNKH